MSVDLTAEAAPIHCDWSRRRRTRRAECEAIYRAKAKRRAAQEAAGIVTLPETPRGSHPVETGGACAQVLYLPGVQVRRS